MNSLRLLLPLLAISTLSFAQKEILGTVKGHLTDDQNIPQPYVMVLLKNNADSTLLKGDLSNEEGSFVFDKIKEGAYFIEIKSVGHSTIIKSGILISETQKEVNLGNIFLLAASQTLETATVQADKPFIERQADRTVVNIENSIIHAGASVLEVMEKLPGVQVNQDGQVSLKGKQAVIILMDGKPTQLSGQDLANMLRGTSSSNIQKIEIITNPSAKYDAAGNAGIINIITKKNRKEGLNGNVGISYGQGRYPKSNNSFSLSKKEKWYNLYTTYAYSYRKFFNNLILNRNFFENDSLTTVFNSNSYIVMPFQTHTPRLGADFYLSKKTTLSALATGTSNSIQPVSGNHTDILDGHGNRVNTFDFNGNSADRWYNYAFNTQLKQLLDSSGKELTADLDYANYWNHNDQLFTNVLRDDDGVYLNHNQLVGKQKGKLNIYSAKADYAQPVWNNARLETGIKSSYVKADNDMRFYNRTNGQDLFDSSRSSHFVYSENINAAYLNLNKEFKKISFQLGLRLENTRAEGLQLLSGQRFDRKYTQVFPSAFVDYKLTDKHGLNFSIGRRIDRPAYQQMNPYRRVIDPTTNAEGNPYLLPQLTYNYELTYSFNNEFFATLGYSFTNNNITDILVQDGVSRITTQTVANIASFNYYNVNLVYTRKLFKWWTTNTNLLMYYGRYAGTVNNYSFDESQPTFYVNTGNSFSIVDGLSAELNFNYAHRNLYGVMMMKSSNNLSAGIQKSLFQKKGSVSLNVSDLLWYSYPRAVNHFGNVYEYWTSKRDTRVVTLSFNYRFGQNPVKVRRNTGADDEKSRVGNS